MVAKLEWKLAAQKDKPMGMTTAGTWDVLTVDGMVDKMVVEKVV